MKRLDRAMYAIFLLALLGDVARVRVPVDAAGGLVLQAAGQHRVEVVGGAFRPAVLRPIARIKSYSLSFLRWAWSLSAATHPDSTASAVLDSVAFEFSAGLCALAVCLLLFGSSLAVFEHLGSPAP